MKKFLGIIFTIFIEAVLVYGLTKVVGWKYEDLAFFVGLLFIVIAYFFSSKGGFSSNSLRLQAQAQSGIKVDEEEYEFRANAVFIGSIVYTILSLFYVIAAYWKYFA
ncbi:hypothetical protein P6P90_03130 [Ectobacillus antri]|jgi:hypothetical protein|uniref:DUF3899 domain-containing protein n=1 Tax=Ectobacillus antri TaxID=2486280 RepID=A0ABT6H1Z3_9BACI|nr:hypothetical protein [Ectobacillus antri]MDG4656317.1 hypothetical protein [Ectobacillus antri]MDG5752992.1 hypothetical protein [Ectobacillus antri]